MEEHLLFHSTFPDRRPSKPQAQTFFAVFNAPLDSACNPDGCLLIVSVVSFLRSSDSQTLSCVDGRVHTMLSVGTNQKAEFTGCFKAPEISVMLIVL